MPAHKHNINWHTKHEGMLIKVEEIFNEIQLFLGGQFLVESHVMIGLQYEDVPLRCSALESKETNIKVENFIHSNKQFAMTKCDENTSCLYGAA